MPLGLLLVISLSTWAQPHSSYLVHCGQLFDSKTAIVKEDLYLLIEDNLITDVLDASIADPELRLIDLSADLFTPGCIDMHVHLERECDKNALFSALSRGAGL